MDRLFQRTALCRRVWTALCFLFVVSVAVHISTPAPAQSQIALGQVVAAASPTDPCSGEHLPAGEHCHLMTVCPACALPARPVGIVLASKMPPTWSMATVETIFAGRLIEPQTRPPSFPHA